MTGESTIRSPGEPWVLPADGRAAPLAAGGRVRRAAWLLAAAVLLTAAASCTSAGNDRGTDTALSPTSGPAFAAGPAPGGGTAPATPPRVSADGSAVLPDPRQRMLLGAYVGQASQPDQGAVVRSRELAMGRPYDLLLTYYDWTDPFPDAGEQAITAGGSIPLMAWYLPGRVAGAAGSAGSAGSLADVASGADDAWITRQALALRAFGHPVFLRLGPEMNGGWYGYSGQPAAYVAAYRRVFALFARAGAANVTWVWCPDVGPADWARYYPGSGYVDVIGVDGFSNAEGAWGTFQQEFDGFFRAMAALAPGKPQLVAETATNSGAGDQDRGIGSAASYITGMRSYLRDVAGPRYHVIGVCWFDTDTDRVLSRTRYDWLTDQTPQSWQAWLTLGRARYFGGHGS